MCAINLWKILSENIEIVKIRENFLIFKQFQKLKTLLRNKIFLFNLLYE